MKAARGHGPAAWLSVRHRRFLRNAAKPKRKNQQRSSDRVRIANALHRSAGIGRNGKRNNSRIGGDYNRSYNPVPRSASSPPASETEADPSMPSESVPNQRGADGGNLRRSTRKRRVLVHVDYESDNSEHEVYRSQTTRVSKHRYASSHAAKAEPIPDEEESPEPAEAKNADAAAAPRREGLRPRQGIRPPRLELSSQDYEDDDQNSSEREMGMKGDAEEEGEEEEEEEEEEEGEEEEEEEEEDEEGEELEGRRRYALRNRTGVQRFSPRKEERTTATVRSPRKMFHGGSSTKRGREGRRSGNRSHKRHRSTRADDSDDSLLVDEQDQGAAPWLRMGRGSGLPWLPPGLEAPGMGNLGAAASGWGQPGSHWASSTPGGAQTAGPSSKGGADIQPVQVDDTVGFDQIGGLAHYIDQLKEMVFFPLLYPDFFAKYHITPPRGVLLSGPPGTGKTLIARAMASAASRAGQKVNFYMRKGADVLSKWVGEAERQLRMLFEEAQRCQPSIIFFDEIDGLAPVRSSKQEQIHNSIVSTLLALMDGLDSRGQVVVIGATNRIDAIDGALRRPGRFDRELILNHPTFEARVEILDIHTRKWQKPPSEELRRELAASCVGYCGADLKALCTEAAIRAFRRKYPQVYRSDEHFVIDVESVEVERRHFLEAVSAITPASHRGAVTYARPFSPVIAPCLEGHLQAIMKKLSGIFPVMNGDASCGGQSDSEEEESPEQLARLFGLGCSAPLVYRPKFLLYGSEGAGLDHVGPAVLHELERFPVHSLGLPSLLSDPSAKSPEEALVHIFGEARRNTPSILYLPQLHLWWDTADDQLRAVLKMLLGDLPSDLPVLFLGTSCVSAKDLGEDILALFGHNCYEVKMPSADVRSRFVSQLVDAAVSVPRRRAVGRNKQKEVLPELPKAPKVVKGPSEAEVRERAELEENHMRRLRMCFRDICNRLLCERRFSIFHYPVLDDEAPDYRNVVHNPMDVATLLQRVDSGRYMTKKSFLADVDLIPANAQEYNGDDYQGGRIVSKACALRDAVLGMASTIDPALVKACDEIAAHGGPPRLAGVPGGVLVPAAAPPVVRASARLRGFQPEVDGSKAADGIARRSRRSSEGLLAGEGANGNCSDGAVDGDASEEVQTEGAEMDVDTPGPEPCDDIQPETIDDRHGNGSLAADARISHGREAVDDQGKPCEERDDDGEESIEKDAEVLKSLKARIDAVKQKLSQQTRGFGVFRLEMLHAKVCRLLQHGHGDSCTTRLALLEKFVAVESNLTCQSGSGERDNPEVGSVDRVQSRG